MSSPAAARRLRTRSDKSKIECKFDKLRRLRATGESAISLMKDEDDDDDMYMRVDEAEYQRQLKSDTTGMHDFIIDDDGAGYADSGTDDIGGETTTSIRKQTKLAAKKSAAPKATPREKRTINTMFKSAHLKAPKKTVTTQDDDAFMSSLIDELEPPPVTPTKSAKRRLAEPVVAKKKGKPVPRMAAVAIGLVDVSNPVLDPLASSPPQKRQRPEEDPFIMSTEEVAAQEPVLGVCATDDELAALEHINVDDLLDMDGLDALDATPTPLYQAQESEPQGTDWQDVHMEVSEQPALANTSMPSPPPPPATGDAQSLRVFWIDASETNNSVFLFGKILHDGHFQSCCLRITNLERNVFLLPRINPQTNERLAASDVHAEFEAMAIRHGIRSFGCKPVNRRYAFEIPGVPASTEYLKVVYAFEQPALPADISGKTFERAFGTSYSALELFMLKRRLMGPSWLNVKEAVPVEEHNRLSWCRWEFDVSDPKSVATMDDESMIREQLPRTPPLTTMTLSLKTVMNHRANANEVVAISVLIHRDISLDDPTPAAKRVSEQQTIVRQLANTPLPADFERMRLAQAKKGLTIEVVRTEGALLNLFTALLRRVDPDILAAHNFYGFDLDVLLHRMQSQRTEGWSKLGRLRRRVMPKLQSGAGGMGESTYGERQVVAGRIVCDTYMASKDLIKAKSYGLSNLTMQELGIRREEIPFERIPEYFTDAKTMLHFLRHAAFDAFLAAALMIRLQALPLTRQLTNLAGNLWSRTLMGARAERNEYLLLHEFYQKKFIRPDRFFGGGNGGGNGGSASGRAASDVKGSAIALKSDSLRAEMAEAIDQLGDDDLDDSEIAAAETATTAVPGKSGRRKPAYLGGLVLEPKRGFYDRFVLLLDFNSLYPSIIQEFNICFTTVRRPVGDETPDTPSPELPPGILPRLLKTLVDRRRQVKNLLKQPNISAEEAEQLDVRQRALKLTANSMYGCLGFTHSRFYAKPLAMLITLRGREILQATRDLALSDGLEVIYGDTDSIMIATRTASLADVYEMGAQFKRRVNERYRLLELDIDGVFKRLLLLKKKKYAALQIIAPEKHRDGQEYNTKLESKGLDLVRRDWCDLSHDVSDFALKRLFADNPVGSEATEHDEDAVIATIHEHLTMVGQAVRANRVPLDKYTVHKGLTKAPENYPDKKSLPHVLVALRLRQKGIAVRAGDTIPYIICDAQCPGMMSTASAANLTDPNAALTGSYAERARHPDEIKESAGQLYPDFQWYLNQQVLPPCGRLLEPLSGTDMPTLAQHLGLDPTKYRSAITSTTSNDTDTLRTLDSQIPDTERFKFAHLFTPTCPGCKTQYVFEGVARAKNGSLESGLACSHCGHMPSPPFLVSQLTLQIRRHIRDYYSFVMVCDEPSCSAKSRVLTVAGSRCLGSQCSGKMHEIYSDKMLYHQLQYFSALLNVDRSAVRLETTSADVRALCERHYECIKRLNAVVETHLMVSARKFVNLSALFSFCRI
ncbi:hypothetical protein BX661DRAFT_203935 [Kickxella alabastrina]|uniref:uncharacterized protein n=1 Tax=Kickxella alabastrina TaxID=61397 RepID=UPI002220D5A9|nr:uncharacterized protein BX661DRAFT_203935 [Kickxella alabastrina]KAI7832947.1 hypothetical protein BX661DRAFT_203935 [Kickxella alabastrina]